MNNMRVRFETLPRTVAKQERMSKLQRHEQSMEIISTKHDLVEVKLGLCSFASNVLCLDCHIIHRGPQWPSG